MINLTSIVSTNLSGLRAEFKDICGIPDMTNSEVDKWLNRGIKLLDQLTDFQYSPARQAIVIPIDTWLVQFLSSCRIIREVTLIDLVENVRNPVELLTHKRFYELYKSIPTDEAGLPEACAPAVTRAANVLSAVGGAATYDSFVESTETGAEYQALLLNCKTDKEYQLEIFGKFYSVPVSDTAVDNWWMLNHSETVIAAAMAKFNLIKLRSSEGAKDYLAEVNGTVTQLDFDAAEQDAERVSRMEG